MKTTRSMRIVVALSLAIVAAGCGKGDGPEPPEASLNEVATWVLHDVPEPSGLALDVDGEHLWTVSDDTGFIYRVQLDGTHVETLHLYGEDLEGIAVDPIDSTLFVVEEALGQVVHLDRSGQVLERLTPSGLPAMGNDGLEGITVDPDTGHLFLLKEKQPGMLIEMDRDGEVLSVIRLHFASDYSGMTADPVTGMLLILSDQDENVTWTDTQGNPQLSLPTGLDKGEGIALDSATGLLYVATDRQETLTVFEVFIP